MSHNNNQKASNKQNTKKNTSNSSINKLLRLLDISIDEPEENMKENRIIDKGKEKSQMMIKEDDTNSKKDIMQTKKNDKQINSFIKDNITEDEIKSLEEMQLVKITEEDFNYSFTSDEEERKGSNNYQEEINTIIYNENNTKKITLKEENQQIQYEKEEEKIKDNLLDDSLKTNTFKELKNSENYSKEKWKKINKEIPTVSIGKQNTLNKEIEYIIENKFINGIDMQTIPDYPNYKYFKNIEFQGKKFMIFIKRSDIIKYNRVYYYFRNHRTSKFSDTLDEKGNKKRFNICNAIIKYNIIKNIYSFFGEHTEECESTLKPEIINKAEINEEINNYDEYLESLKIISKISNNNICRILKNMVKI